MWGYTVNPPGLGAETSPLSVKDLEADAASLAGNDRPRSSERADSPGERCRVGTYSSPVCLQVATVIPDGEKGVRFAKV